MFATSPRASVNYSYLFRWSARAAGALLMVSWLALFISEITRQGLGKPAFNTHGQAAALAIVFAGYILGWWKEFAGGVLAIVGTLAFFAVIVATDAMPPEAGMVWFAAPGILYLLASFYSDKRSEQVK